MTKPADIVARLRRALPRGQTLPDQAWPRLIAAAAASLVVWRLNVEKRSRWDAAHRDARQTSEPFRLAFHSSASGMALIAPDGRYMSVNRALCGITGYSEEELLGRTFHDVTHPDDLAAYADGERALLEGDVDAYETEKRYLHRHGHEVWVRIAVTAARGERGEVLYFISQTHDVTTRRRFEHELAHRALHDPLTGLPTRALFLDRLRHALVRSRRHSGSIAILFVDLDRFKLVNDGIGHTAGDEVLQHAAKRLSAVARAEDTIARFGGDEFTMICEGAGNEEACHIATRVLEAFARPFAAEGREFHLSASVGIRVGDAGAESPDSLLRDADTALCLAKQHGRSRFEVFDPEAPAGVDMLATEQALRLAMRHGELCLHYQPEVDLETLRITAVEALVRWQHPERGLVPPGEFIPAAEDSGLIVPLGEWVLREACAQLSAWRRAGTVDPRVRVAVNVSARQLSHPGLPSTVAAALAGAELGSTALCLEITESAIIQDTGVALANLDAIKRQGVAIALDDFGVGFSSLDQIRELPPVDVIKVDRSFTAGLGTNESDRAVVNAVLSLTRSLGLTAVAEGVETESQLGLLRRLGCGVGQGFYFARPQPAWEIEHLLSKGGAPSSHEGDPAVF